MILRKPYAFFIKYFKIIHLIMAVFMCLLIFQTNSFLVFFNQYINSEVIIVGQALSSNTFSTFSYLYISLVLILDVIIWILLEFKDKKRLFYVLNFIGYILVLALYVYLNSLLATMEKQIVDTRLLMTVRDLVIICFTVQTVSTFFVIVRFLGVDIRKFNFESDLKELDVLETDNEEFEVNLNFDKEKIRRNVNSHFRNFKYYFKENIRIIVPILIISFLMVGIFVYKNTTDNVTTYKQDVYFNVPNYSLKVTDTYITNKNYKMNYINDESSLVILRLNIKTTNNSEQFLFGKFALKIGNKKYYHTTEYSDDIKDIGNTYIKQRLSKDYKEYLLVYEVPNSVIDEEMELVYVNELASGIFEKDTLTKVDLNPINLDGEQNQINIILNEQTLLNDNFSGINTITFKTIKMADIFNLSYNYCVVSNIECYTFYEPLQANFSGSYDKALLKIEFDIGATNYSSIKGLEYVLSFAKINYKINEKNKTFYLQKSVSPKKVNSNAYYFEIPIEVISAENVNFIFSLRENILFYKLK